MTCTDDFLGSSFVSRGLFGIVNCSVDIEKVMSPGNQCVHAMQFMKQWDTV